MAVYGIKSNKSLVDLDERSGEFFAGISVDDPPYLSNSMYKDITFYPIYSTGLLKGYSEGGLTIVPQEKGRVANVYAIYAQFDFFLYSNGHGGLVEDIIDIKVVDDDYSELETFPRIYVPAKTSDDSLLNVRKTFILNPDLFGSPYFSFQCKCANNNYMCLTYTSTLYLKAIRVED